MCVLLLKGKCEIILIQPHMNHCLKLHTTKERTQLDHFRLWFPEKENALVDLANIRGRQLIAKSEMNTMDHIVIKSKNKVSLYYNILGRCRVSTSFERTLSIKGSQCRSMSNTRSPPRGQIVIMNYMSIKCYGANWEVGNVYPLHCHYITGNYCVV